MNREFYDDRTIDPTRDLRHRARVRRVGGREVNRGGPPGGPVYTYDARYGDIVPNERIVYSYTMDCGDARISVSVTTVEVPRRRRHAADARARDKRIAG
jgi:uncharacterized protein YndB with AHSA1/START domain